uniref:Reverse transcriptase domain-containing protein n=1 Tax=Heterorhabditis bacteriophora TaxID=37862 RepID=A0A1I7WHF3_HETBA
MHRHPLSTPDKAFPRLNQGTLFSQIDLADAYIQYNQLLLGVKSAPNHGFSYFDDIIKIQEYISHVRLQKCKFTQSRIGKTSRPEKLAVITKMPTPQNINELQIFLG